MSLVVLLLFLITGGVAAAVVLTGSEDAELVWPGDPLTTPDGTVEAFFDARGQGDCTTVDGFRTEALRAEVAADDDENCAHLAALAEEEPSRLDNLPQVTTEVRYQDESVAVVDVTFDSSADEPDHIRDLFLVRQPNGTWLLATRAEVESLSPDNPSLVADVLVAVAPDADASQRAAIEAVLEKRDGVQAFVYFDEADSAAELRRLFQDNAEMLDRLATDPESFPTFYRVVLSSPDDEAVRDALTVELQQLPGVEEVVDVPR